jgi:serine/threonine-protein kinase
MNKIKQFLHNQKIFLVELINGNSQDIIRFRTLLRFFIFILIFFGLFFGITFIVLLRPSEKILLPDFSGKDVITVIRELQKNKLKPYIRQANHRTIPKYYVISQKPQPGTMIKQKRTIVLTVSLGEKASHIPDFTGIDIDTAKEELLLLFSAYEKIPTIKEQHIYSTNITKGLIIEQYPSPHEKLHINQDIMFLVSRGVATNVLTVSNYRGKSFKDIERFLTEFGIQVSYDAIETKYEKYIGKISKQNQSPGTTLTKGDSIHLIVGLKQKPLIDDRDTREQLRI